MERTWSSTGGARPARRATWIPCDRLHAPGRNRYRKVTACTARAGVRERVAPVNGQTLGVPPLLAGAGRHSGKDVRQVGAHPGVLIDGARHVEEGDKRVGVLKLAGEGMVVRREEGEASRLHHEVAERAIRDGHPIKRRSAP